MMRITNIIVIILLLLTTKLFSQNPVWNLDPNVYYILCTKDGQEVYISNPNLLDVSRGTNSVSISAGAWATVPFTTAIHSNLQQGELTFNADGTITFNTGGQYVISVHVEVQGALTNQSQVTLKAEQGINPIWALVPGSMSSTYIDGNTGNLGLGTSQGGLNAMFFLNIPAGDNLRIQVYPGTGTSWIISGRTLFIERL